MESTGYEPRERSLVGTLAALTYDILNRAGTEADEETVTAHPAARVHRGLLDRLDTWFWQQELKSREAFLAQSADVVELEQRMRWLERGRG
ncbi:MAG: hypothetical protein ACREYB_02055 [Casimicrobiaceae bacterium]